MAEGIEFSLIAEDEKGPSEANKEIVVDCRGLFGVSTIQEALKLAKDGDSLKIMPGNYFESVFLSKRVSLLGCPSSTEKCIITSGSQSTLSIVTRIGDIPRMTIRGIQFECWNGAIGTESPTAAVFIRSGNIHFADCTIIGGLPTSIIIKGDTHSPPTSISFVGCTIKESRGHGISVELCHSVTLQNCIFSEVQESAVLAKLKSSVYIEKTQMIGCDSGAHYSDSSIGGISESKIMDSKKIRHHSAISLKCAHPKEQN
eukprot:TRINITY_DN10309_c0_g1_i3.p1 TRINITY_DN10309_c0_g1~~TRINITY_DN10309_c0_g1_i3.p1  ORF type:complete len:258 (+),score=41.91 TRINITY_DN10309_c0_g1_i3:69-842(+)